MNHKRLAATGAALCAIAAGVAGTQASASAAGGYYFPSTNVTVTQIAGGTATASYSPGYYSGFKVSGRIVTICKGQDTGNYSEESAYAKIRYADGVETTTRVWSPGCDGATPRLAPITQITACYETFLDGPGKQSGGKSTTCKSANVQDVYPTYLGFPIIP